MADSPVPAGLPLIAPDVVEQDFPDTLDNIIPTRGYTMVPMVGLGGSAGSIVALREFFGAMPADSGMAFVVVLHLAPEHESTLPELLGRTTAMRVEQASQGVKVEANCVYVIPPGKHLSADDGHLRLTDLETSPGKRVAVDLFFRSLADTHGAHAAAIVLSGADGDGAIGLKRIKERGGLTIAQDPDEAEHASMPRAAIDTGMVDWVLEVAQMPGRLMEYRANEERLKLPPEQGPQPAKAPAVSPDEAEKALREVLTFLRSRTGRDFSYYKRATILRRISRRMQVNGVHHLPEYLTFLRTHSGEIGALQQDLLVSVTNFFRDRETFAALEERIPDLFAGKGTGDAVRVWIPACATGEEAYSIAMLLCEHAATLDAPPSIQVFATDLDEDAIRKAREGLYPLATTADVSEDRLRRFFIKERHGYRVRREIREITLFAVHDLLKDSPFSRLDLVSCRNLLIYLDRDAQKRVFEIFHFALRPGARLFLGSSESMDEESPLFVVLDKKHRLYAQRSVPHPGLPLSVDTTTLRRAIEAQEHAKTGPFTHGPAFAASSGLAVKRELEIEERRASWEELHFRLIERFAPPSLIVDRDYNLVHVSETAGRFLRIVGGEPSLNLLKVVHPALRVELRAALFRAAQTSATIEVFRVPIELEGEPRLIDIRVSPANEIAPDFLLVVFSPRESADVVEVKSARLEAEPAVRFLEREVEQLKSRLRDTVEQYEASTEELKASNEELQAMNEELRSATEELETGREELQSINEELTTVNQELKGKVDELGHSNSDMQNLMAASEFAIVFLDRTLRITLYTPAAIELFHLIPGDIGRPLNDLQHELAYPEIKGDAERVLRTLVPQEREVADANGRWFLTRLLPYRSTEDQIGGVVLSFVDITKRREAEIAMRASEERLRLVVENARDYAIFSMSLDRRITSWNAGAHRILGYTEDEAMGQMGDIIFTEEDRAAGAPEQEAATAMAEGRASDERWHLCKDGRRFWGSGVMMAMHDAQGEAIGLVKVFRDHTERLLAKKALEQALQDTEAARAEAEAAGKAKDHFLAVLSHELRTPLTPVLMSVDFLMLQPDLPPHVMEGLEMIQRNVTLESQFIDELLDLTRISRGKFELSREPLDLHEVIRLAAEVARPDIEAKSQRLNSELNAERHELIGDIKRLQQVFWNLLKNAAKFTSERGAITIRTRNEPAAPHSPELIVVEISDDGIGFDPEAAERIFTAFTQASEEITQKFGGLGLGLAISKATVDAHHGTLHASSAGAGQGATFTVCLPLA
jgi:two-component system CheB/CheR fusion protein